VRRALVGLALALAACGTPVEPTSGPSSSPEPASDGVEVLPQEDGVTCYRTRTFDGVAMSCVAAVPR
jgi:hypothetical protein